MNLDYFNNKILIIKDKTKNSLLNTINKSKKLYNIKIITLSELKKKYFFDYDKESIYYLVNKYNIVSDLARIYLENMYYIKDIDNIKIKKLIDLKKELDDNNLLKYNDLFKNYLKNKKIVLYDLKNIDNFYINIFNELKKCNDVEEYIYDNPTSIKELYRANDIEDEITFVASKICELVKSGININNIKISNVNNENSTIIKRIFGYFNIPVNINSNISIKGSKIIKEFKNNYSKNICDTFDIIKKYIVNKDDNELYKQLVNIVNSYSFVDDYDLVKTLVYEDIDNIKTKSISFQNSVKVVDINDNIISDDDYVFLVNYNEGIIPVNYKNEDFLNDEIKKQLGISDSNDLNYKSEINLREKISKLNHLIVTYSKYNMGSEIYISSSYSKELFDEKDIHISFNHSNLFNKLKLVSLKDENRKYNTISKELLVLNKHYKDEDYLTYSNKFKGLDNKMLYDFLGNKLCLSYSSLNTYYECGFKYYLNNVLRLDKFEDSFEIHIGNIFHHILSKCFISDINFDEEWNKEVIGCNYEFNNMQKYFLGILKEELKLVIETIKEQLKYTSLTKIMCEKEIIINVNEDLHITFKGFVDKIMYNEFNGTTIVAIVDYKTGNPIININNCKYGLDMQLPIYMYLIKNSNIVSNVRIGGFYLQKILSSSKNRNDRIESLKLQGYSNSDIDILSKVDSSYNNSNIIKSLKTSSNGFYAYSKVLNDDEFDFISNLVNEKVNECGLDIINGKFNINPKKINDVNKSCKYCKYIDICYMNNDDIIEFEPVKNIFGGEE